MKDEVTEAAEINEMFDLTFGLIQEAKGAGGPHDGFVTDHLDAAEGWIARIQEALTAQAAEIEDVRAKLRNIISHATGGSLSDHADVPLNDVCVEISRFRNQLYQDGMDKASAEIERLKDEIAELDADREAYNDIVDGLYGGLDTVDAIADKWVNLVGVQRMVQAITSVFAKYSNDEIMTRFQMKIVEMLRNAFVEGALAGSAGIKDAFAAEKADRISAETTTDQLRKDLGEALEVVRAFMNEIAGKPVGGGDGSTYIISTPSSATLEQASALLSRKGDEQ